MKRWKLMLVTAMVVLGSAGCGGQGGKNSEASAEPPAEEVQAEGEASAKAPEDEVPGGGGASAKAPGDAVQAKSEIAESEAEEKNDAFDDLEAKGSNGEIALFAEKIQAAVADQDMEALAGLCVFPMTVDGEAVESRDAFLALGGETIFTDERCAVIAAVDISALEETMAGVVMGDGTPNIIFRSVDGKLGIAGIN